MEAAGTVLEVLSVSFGTLQQAVAGRPRAPGKLERVTCLASPVLLLQGLLRRQSSTPKVVPGAALPWLELGRVGGYKRFSFEGFQEGFGISGHLLIPWDAAATLKEVRVVCLGSYGFYDRFSAKLHC